jgi:iron(III) transport system ATP-binding protein
MPTITLRQARKTYPGSSTDAVRSLDLEIADGEFMCLLGPSGCGKTTTLRMIAGLENLSGGELQIGDRLVDCVENAVFVPPERRQLGLVFQSYALWPHLTIERNIDFGLRLRKEPRASREARVAEVMTALGIEQYRDRYPSQLSGGQQQRVALARMLAVSPQVLLLDEPLSNLDARLRLEMRAELKRIHEKFGTTIVFVTHDQWEAMTLATTIAVMSDGTLQQMGTPDDIYERPANRFVAEFVGSPPINMMDLDAPQPSGLVQSLRDFLAEVAPGIGEVGSVGIRPEAIRLHQSPGLVPEGRFAIPGRVTGVLPTGGSWIVEVEAGGQTLFMTTHVAPELGKGAHVIAAVRPSNMHLFDAQGQRVATADRALGRAAA